MPKKEECQHEVLCAKCGEYIHVKAQKRKGEEKDDENDKDKDKDKFPVHRG